MSQSICRIVSGLIMLLVTLPLCGQELSDGSDNASQFRVETQLENIVKVFQIEHADASELNKIIDVLFRETTDDNSHGSQQLRFGVDTRTNSIFASGPAGDLQVIEDLLVRLDTPTRTQKTIPQRTSIYRLQNAAVGDVAATVSQWLTERAKLDGQGNLDEGSEESEVLEKMNCILIPVIVNNSLIVSTSFNEERAAKLEQAIRGLDARPDMVKVKVVMKKTVDGVETVIARPHLTTIVKETGSLTVGSALESYTIEMTPYIIRGEIRGDKPVEVINLPAKSKDR